MKPTISFVYDLDPTTWWRDGLFMALKVLEEDFTIIRTNLALSTELPHADLTLAWGSFNSRVDLAVNKLECQKALCIAGNFYPPKNASKYDCLFYESSWYRPQIDFHPHIVKAFGVNTDTFRPVKSERLFNYIGAGSLALWKRWEKFTTKPGVNIVIGDIQKNNLSESLAIANELLKAGVIVSNQLNPELLAYYMNSARCAYVPASIIGGGERFVWEAKACGLPVEIEPDNPKLQEFVDQPVKDYLHYAKQLKKGIERVLA